MTDREDRWSLLVGDCRALLPTLPDCSIDSCVTDAPYELGFMGRKWDASGIAYDVDMWREVLRVLKPGGHLLAFGGTRTYHRMACAIEDAGFDIRDCIQWLYASGFPKSLDVSKAIDAHFGNERPDRTTSGNDCAVFSATVRPENRGTPIAAAAAAWSGYGTALKPAQECVVWATKPAAFATHCARIGSCLSALCASIARSTSASSQSASGAAFDSVLTSAARQFATPGDSFAAMATSRSASARDLSLSIVSSWLATLDALCDPTSTSTTEMDASLTTDLQTLSCLALRLTPADIIRAAIEPSGCAAHVALAASLFGVVALKTEHIRIRSAIATATDSALADFLAADAKVGCSPIVVARKPLIGTVAANVLAHGTGGINVDGCRIPFASEDDQAAAAAAAAAQRLCREPQHGHGIGDMGIHGENQASSLAPYLASMDAGRWPANVIHDGSPEVLEAFARYGDRPSGASVGDGGRIFGAGGGPTHDGYPGDDGSAARFFKSCPFGKEDQWSASSAKSNSSQPSEPDGSAPSRAAIEEVREGRAFGASSPAPTTNATESGSRPDSGSATGTTRGTEQKSSSASPRANASTSESHASDADQRGQTDTTTTTPSRSMSDGSAASATLPITSGSTAHGVPVCRFMFCAKASRAERELGCEGLAARTREDVTGREADSAGQNHARSGMTRTGAIRNIHPTVKPLALLRYLCRLVTPPGGTVLDPFSGSGTCGMAALLEGFRYVGMELLEEHATIARARISHPLRIDVPEEKTPSGASQLGLFGMVGT